MSTQTQSGSVLNIGPGGLSRPAEPAQIRPTVDAAQSTEPTPDKPAPTTNPEIAEAPSEAVEDPAAGADTTAATWLQPRAEIAARLCAATAPGFKSFVARADEFGFEIQPDGARRREPDLVANLLPAASGCACAVAFRADDGQAAADAIAAQLVKFRDIQVAPHEDPQVWARLVHRDGETQIRLSGAEQAGISWLQAVFVSPQECPRTEVDQ